MSTRYWCFTLHVERTKEENDEKLLDQLSYFQDIVANRGIVYLVCQLEKCPETGRIHYQGYFELKTNKGLKGVKEIFEPWKPHFEKRRGTREQAVEYCKKEESRVDGPWEFGKLPKGKGERTDIQQYADIIKNKGITALLDESPEAILKFGKGCQKLHEMYSKRNSKKLRFVDVHVIYGEAGSGKTRYVYETEGIDNIYRLVLNESKNIWFDGYDGERVLLIDEFDCDLISRNYLLQLLDIYPFQLPIKGSHTYANWDKVYITSNYHPENWKYYDQALKRRIKTVTNK